MIVFSSHVAINDYIVKLTLSCFEMLIIMHRPQRKSSCKVVAALPQPPAAASAVAVDTPNRANTADIAIAATTANDKTKLQPVVPLSSLKHQPATHSTGTTAASKTAREHDAVVNGGKIAASKRRSSVTDTTVATPTTPAVAAAFNRGRAVHGNANDNGSTNSTVSIKHRKHQQQQQFDDNNDNNSLGLSSDHSMTESEGDD
jgi:hypothetical protein